MDRSGALRDALLRSSLPEDYVPEGEGELALHIACRDGNAELARRLLDAGFGPRKPAAGGGGGNAGPLQESPFRYPLTIAAENGRLDIIDLLVSHGADVRHADVSGFEALHSACLDGDVATALHLVGKGALSPRQPPTVRARITQADSPLASYIARAGTLESEAVPCEIRPVHVIADAGNVDFLDRWLSFRVDPPFLDENGLNPWCLGADMLEELRNGERYGVNLALKSACCQLNAPMLKYLVEKVGIDQRNVFFPSRCHFLRCAIEDDDGYQIDVIDERCVDVCRYLLIADGFDPLRETNSVSGAMRAADDCIRCGSICKFVRSPEALATLMLAGVSYGCCSPGGGGNSMWKLARALARHHVLDQFLMGGHDRLGADSPIRLIDQSLALAISDILVSDY